jgi:hypothetical protein
LGQARKRSALDLAAALQRSRIEWEKCLVRPETALDQQTNRHRQKVGADL